MNLPPIERNKDNALIRMTPSQRKRANALIRKTCCNYFDGQCVALDCECVQCNSYSVCCKWFRHCILPQDKSLFAEIVQPQNVKQCAVCGKAFTPKSNRAKYCSDCAKAVHRKQKNKSERKLRLKSGQLDV